MTVTRHSLRLSLLMLVGATFYLGGCGPQDFDDPEYLAQVRDSGYIDDAALSAQEKTQEDMNGDENEMEGMDENGEAMGTPAMATTPGVAPRGRAVAVPPVRPVPVVKLPPGYVRAPTLVAPQPPIITHSNEQRLFERDILHVRDVIKDQPSVNNHLITNNLVTNHRYKTNIINRPSFANIVHVRATAAETHTVLPTTVVNAPPLVAPPVIGVPLPPPRPPCGPFSIYRGCRGGPFLR